MHRSEVANDDGLLPVDLESATKWALDGREIVRSLFERTGSLELRGFVLATVDPRDGRELAAPRTVAVYGGACGSHTFMDGLMGIITKANGLGAIVAWSEPDELIMVFHASGGAASRTWVAPIDGSGKAGDFAEVSEPLS